MVLPLSGNSNVGCGWMEMRGVDKKQVVVREVIDQDSAGRVT